MKLSVLVIALCLMTAVNAVSLSFMEGPYKLLDIVVMTFWKPLMDLVLIGWAKNIFCGTILTQALDAFDLDQGSLTDAEIETECFLGITMFQDQFFYSGDISNKPFTFSWIWDPKADLTS